MVEPNVPDALLSFVKDDLAPVRPLALPSKRALALAPLGLALLLGTPWFWGFRNNFSELGAALGWGVSGLQTLAGLGVIGLALRESIPGRELSKRCVISVLAGSTLLVVAVTLVTSGLVPAAPVPAGAAWRYVWECYGMALAPGLLAVAVAAFMASRAFPGRPQVAGTLCGLGAGLMADSGARLFCWVSSPGHVLLSHGGAIVSLTLLGALVATGLEALRRSFRPRGRFRA